MPYRLSDEQVANIVNIVAANEHVQEAVLFGSRAKGTQRPGSDIDIALKGDSLTLNDLLSLSIALDELWLPFRFDLVLYHRINEPALRSHIDRVGKLIVPTQSTVLTTITPKP